MQLEEIKGIVNRQKSETMSLTPYFGELLYLNAGIYNFKKIVTT